MINRELKLKNILLVFFMMTLVGCNKVENETKKMVLDSLKDPSSAEFQNVKGYCGEVNAKNSYGGYTGFKSFYISNGVPVFFDDNKDDALKFELGWTAHCESDDSKLSNDQKTSCVSYANFSGSVVHNKLIGGSRDPIINIVKNNDSANIFIDTINEVFKNKDINNPKKYAFNVLNDCLSGKKKVPI